MGMKMKTYAVVVAGGMGQRMGKPVPKQFLPLGDRPILAVTLEVFEHTDVIDAVVVAVPPVHVERTRAEIVEKYGFKKVETVCAGGDRRQDSVWEGLKAIKPPCDVVAIHDGVRPLIRPELITKSVMVARHFGGALVAHPVRSTIKIISDDGFVVSTPERRTLVAAQTPQTFAYQMILDAYKEAIRMDFRATDDAQIAEHAGARVIIVQGDAENLKITTETDLELAEIILKKRIKAIEESAKRND
jgi:2-C-methyl-D-erythritol 4-phosphate cytidylyltransferase